MKVFGRFSNYEDLHTKCAVVSSFPPGTTPYLLFSRTLANQIFHAMKIINSMQFEQTISQKHVSLWCIYASKLYQQLYSHNVQAKAPSRVDPTVNASY